MNFRPLSNYLPYFSPRKSQELRIRELELRLATLEDIVQRLDKIYWKGLDE